MTADHVSGWSHGALQKVSRLISARMVTQLIGIGWFLVVARVFDSGELGVLAAGLVTFAAVSVVGDLGTTWSIAREVTSHAHHAWPLYKQGVRLRLVGVTVVGAPVLLAGAFLVERRVLLAMSIGVAIALASGVTEIGMTTLRAVGAVRLESYALPGERVAFIALASVVLLAGRGANAVLGVYLLTNLATAFVAWRVVHRGHRTTAGEARPRLWSTETRRVGVSFAVLALGPRANGLVLVILASRLEVADYTVASRPVEQLALTVFGFSTTMLPLLRDDHMQGRTPGLRVGTLAATVTVVALPGIVLAVLSAQRLVDLVYGAGRYPGAATVLAVVGAVTVTWPLRGLAGMLMIARSRASELARISLAGLVLNLALAIPLAVTHGASGSAAALLVTEVVTVGVLLSASGVALPNGQRHRFVLAGALGISAGAVGALMPLAVALVVVGVASVGAAGLSLGANRAAARSGEVVWS